MTEIRAPMNDFGNCVQEIYYNLKGGLQLQNEECAVADLSGHKEKVRVRNANYCFNIENSILS